MGCGNYSVSQERRNSTLLPQHTGCQWLSPCKAHKKWSQNLEKPLLGTCWGWSVQAGRTRLPSTLWEGHMCRTRCEKRDCHVLGLAVNCSRIKKQKNPMSKTPPPQAVHYQHPSESAQDECLLEQSSILSFNVYKNHGCSQQPPPLWLSCSVCQGQDRNMEITSVPFPNITPRGLQPPSTLGIPCFDLFPSDAILRSFFHLTLSLWRPQGSPPGPPKMTTDPTAGVLCPFPICIQASPGCPVKSTSLTARGSIQPHLRSTECPQPARYSQSSSTQTEASSTNRDKRPPSLCPKG